MIRGLASVLLVSACGPDASAPENPPPNVVLILADDLGWKDVSHAGSGYPTPHIDQLASQGMRFTQAYSAAPSCSPSRAALLTGWSPARLGITRALRGRDYEKDPSVPAKPTKAWPFLPHPNGTRLPEDAQTFAEHLRAAGYETAFLGKWHLGRIQDGPGQHGFEHEGFVGSVGASDYFPPYRVEKGGPTRPGEYLTDRLTDEAVAFLAREHARPFCLVLAHFAVHSPYQAKPELVAELARRLDPRSPQHNPTYGAMIASLDQSVGRVVEALEANGLAGNTLVIFTSDNGAFLGADGDLTTTAPLRGGKLELYEGGVRVPLVVRWPGVVAPGSSSSVPVIGTDLAPTILGAAGLDPTRLGGDGQDLAPLLGAHGTLARDRLHFFVPHRYAHAALRAGDWKLIHWFEGRNELYDVAADPGERADRSAAEPELTAALEAELMAWIQAQGARRPVPNPRYDPDAHAARAAEDAED
jgi:arylsulfatase A-like enzyme